MRSPLSHADGPDRDRLGVKTIWRVAQHDLFGTKDVQDSPTLSYIWLADQFGHIGIGFMGSLSVAQLMGWLEGFFLAMPQSIEARTAIASVLAAAFIVWKEWRDFRSEQDQSKPGTADRPEPFSFNAGEVLNNCVCACFFTISGAVIAVAGVYRPIAGVVAFFALLLVACGVAYWWLKRKVAFQQADLPYLYRLAKFPRNFTNASAEGIVHDLICAPNPTYRHVVICGPLGAGKTSLAVGIGTEAAFRLQIARFTSMIKLNQVSAAIQAGQKRPGPRPDTEFNDGRVLWPLGSVDLLIVDDFDGGIIGPGAATPSAVVAALLIAPGKPFFDDYAVRRTVWVAGPCDDIGEWQAAVARLIGDEDPSKIAVVSLREEYDAALSRPE